MFIDARHVGERATLEADVCVVGTGAAGLPLALKLAHTRLRVVLLESGGLAAERDGRQLYRVVNDPSLRLVKDARRTCFFGGATNHWWGNCRPFDETDFAPREWIPYSGWPIRRDELLPYYEQALKFCGLGDFRFYDGDERGPSLHWRPVDVDAAMLIHKAVQTCPVPSFGHLCRQRLQEAGNVRVCLHARALRLETNAGGDVVHAVTASARDGRRFRITAHLFVLAAGGIENPRLLLCSNAANSNGLANANDLVGRFFMEHPFVDIPLGRRNHDAALLSLRRDLTHTGTLNAWPQVSLSPELMSRERISAISVWFDRPRLPWRAGRARVEALLRGRSPDREAWPTSARMRREVSEAARFMWRRLARHSCLRVVLEQTPDRDNRIRLSPAADRYGQPGVTLSFRVTDEDRRRHGRALRLVGDELGLDGEHIEKQLHRSFRDGQFDFSWHHMGTTRMHADPQLGVVDADCRAHSVSNLFIAGSSVFPTCGAAPPTLTIVALSLRLAEHIARLVA